MSSGPNNHNNSNRQNNLGGGAHNNSNTLQFNSSHGNLLDDTEDNDYIGGNDNIEYQQ